MAKGQAEGKRSEPASRSNEAVKAVKGLAWRLPVLKTQDLGKIGPGLGVGAGCGVGVGFGLFGGAGLGIGMPGLHFGVGAGVGCGIGLGFGYGVGKGVAFDENGKYTNVGKLFQRNVASNHQIGALVDEVVFNAKRLVQATSKEIEKWR
ncbi:chorion class B protein M3A5-like [Zingiber officinale]|uniref:Uncharacterized protein n=2 Tax=Zingiber officinale TaxID=94328 RepID=A0A8J5KPF6_ZINOF|nr:chorion class B protein M3A5-like [Zingiber officinale]KAG6492062.1 hypothetical protein ZIOFF_047012 [Zingiber officinale]